MQAGSVLSTETLTDLGAIDLAALADPPAPKVLIVDRDDKPASSSLLSAFALWGRARSRRERRTDLALDRPTEYATVAGDIVDEICRWVGAG